MRHEFQRPLNVRESGKSYFFDVDGEELKLPIKETQLEWTDTPDGTLVAAVEIPQFIAEDRGLVEPIKEDTSVDTMSRHDWFMAAAIAGLCASQGPQIDCSRMHASDVCEAARKIADKATE